MITQVHQAMPEHSINQLCKTLQVSRSWYYERQSRPEADEAEIELRDAIEDIILDFPGYGYRRVTHCIGYLVYPFEKVAPWAFIAHLFLVISWDSAIERAGEWFSYTRENRRVWAAGHQGRHTKSAGEVFQ